MSDKFDTAEFIAGFVAEAEDHLSSASTNLLSVEGAAAKGQATPRQVRDLFRSLHTLKGLAAMVGVEPIVELAHAMESVLREADRAAGTLPVGAVPLLLDGVAAIEHRVRALADRQVVVAAPPKLVEALGNLRQVGADRAMTSADTSLSPELWDKLGPAERTQIVQALTEGRRAFVVPFVPTLERASRGLTITSVRERVAALAEIVKVVPQSIAASDEAPGGLAFALLVLLASQDDAALADAAATTPESLVPITLEGVAAAPAPESLEEVADEALQHRGVVRVEVARLDEALERLSALVVTQFRLVRTLAAMREGGADVRALAQVVADNGRQLRDLRASIMHARMVSVAEMLDRIPLIVRGLSRATGKEVRLTIAAGKAELDKAVAERIFPAVVHLVRNAVDHALEDAEERRAAGKPEGGHVTVACRELSDSQLELTISDDGRGVDSAAVARRAGAPLPTGDEGLLELLTRPGLSTKAEVTKTSGRGVGMDVVKRIVVEELGGELSLRTSRGQGTTFTLQLPLSITIVDAFSFLCAGETFVVPVAMVEEIQELDPARTVRGPDRRKAPRPGPERRRTVRAAEMIHRRGEAVPVLRLDELLGLGEATELGRKAIVVRRGGESFAFAIERMLGQQEVVVRPLEDALVRVHGVTGTTDLGDGRPTLVLDLAAIGGRLTSPVVGGQP